LSLVVPAQIIMRQRAIEHCWTCSSWRSLRSARSAFGRSSRETCACGEPETPRCL